NLTTITGFGILAFASVPVLSAIGMTVGPSALLCLVFAAMMSGPAGKRLHPLPARTGGRWRPSPAIRASIWLHVLAALGAAAIVVGGMVDGVGAGGSAGTWASWTPWALAALAGAIVLNHAALTAAGLCPRC